ncbi:glycosyltransferase family 2 protein [Flavobacterium sp. WC2409]|uniref:Glycosyltransferase family 2 protein n=1 Tax=Flavobacterium sp. WC2409 TaxID=3234139 RepID=A0AB39W551_9FLAO
MDKDVNKPVVSVIMPAYNASAYIQESINSVIAQKYTNWELIIIDDGSTDRTSEIIINNCSQDLRIKYFHQENGKQGKARNLGLLHSRGKYIAFLDADDLWLAEKLDIQLEEIKAKNVDLVFANSYVFNNDNISDRSRKINILNQVFKGEEALSLFLEINRIPILTVLAKKEKILLVDGFSEKPAIQNAEDYHLWLKMLISGFVFYGSEKTLASYRDHSESSTSHDKLASKQLPEVFFDLLQNNSDEKHFFLNALKKQLRKRYARRFYMKSEFNVIIDENCRYLDKPYYAPLFKAMNFFIGIKMTKKFLNHFINA